MVKYLKYPAKQQVDKNSQKRVKFFITLLTVIMLLPSAYLAYSLYNEQQFKKSAEEFVENEFSRRGFTVVYKKTTYKPKRIELAFLNKRIDTNGLKVLKRKIKANRYLSGTILQVRQDSTERFSMLRGDILNQVKGAENEINEKDVKILQLEKELAGYKFNNAALLSEVTALYPEITSLSVSTQNMPVGKDSIANFTAIIYRGTKDLPAKDTERLQNWLKQRLSAKEVVLFRKD